MRLWLKNNYFNYSIHFLFQFQRQMSSFSRQLKLTSAFTQLSSVGDTYCFALRVKCSEMSPTDSIVEILDRFNLVQFVPGKLNDAYFIKENATRNLIEVD